MVERAKEALSEEALRLGLGKDQDIEVISIEDFPVVEGWQSMERLITVKVQLAAGETVCGIKAYPIVSVMDLDWGYDKVINTNVGDTLHTDKMHQIIVLGSSVFPCL